MEHVENQAAFRRWNALAEKSSAVGAEQLSPARSRKAECWVECKVELSPFRDGTVESAPETPDAEFLDPPSGKKQRN